MSISVAQRRQAHLSGVSGDIAQNNLYLPNALVNAPMNSRLPAMTAGLLTVTNTAYWIYVGQSSKDILATQIYFFVSVAAAGDTQVQELVIAQSSAAPNRAAQVLSVKAVASVTGDYEAAAGNFTNTTAFNYHIPAGTHVWLGCRFAWSGTPTQPTVAARGLDTGKGAALVTATPGVLAVGNYTGALITQSTTLTTAQVPDLTLVGS